MTYPVPSANNAGSASAARGMSSGVRSAIAVEDWDVLFDAVKARLQLSANAAPDRLRAIVLECAQALGQLQHMRVAERHQSRAVTLHSLVIERLIKLPERDLSYSKATSSSAPPTSTATRRKT